MRKELCRNFQRGSCQYGARCKFLHSTQQQQNPNPFGFGTQAGTQQQQQQKSNPFGFGAPSGSQSAGFNKSNQSKPFENKWSRFSPITGGGASAQHTGNQSQQTDHKCTDPVACKRIIQEDFKNERPLWKLTCYGHWKSLPCDIVGDISPEELRAAAYDDAKQGSSLQSIVQRERNLLNSKLAEYENFLHSPYKSPASPSIPGQTTVFGNPPSTLPPSGQISSPPAFLGFAQQVASPNTGFGVRPALPSQSSSGPPSSFTGFNQPTGTFGTNFPQPVPSGPSGFQFQTPITGSPFPLKPAAFGTSDTPKINQFSASTSPTTIPNLSLNQTPFGSNFPASSSAAPETNIMNRPSGTDLQREVDSGETSIWLKEKWRPGEIPEQAPPDAFV